MLVDILDAADGALTFNNSHQQQQQHQPRLRLLAVEGLSLLLALFQGQDEATSTAFFFRFLKKANS